MGYIYGPVHSRRLGLSLGVNVTPNRVCSFDCVYCEEAVPTRTLTLERREYAPTKDVIDEIKSTATNDLDYITFSGEGEPTLHSELGTIIDKIKSALNIRVAVLTNSTLLHRDDVISDLKKADLIVPSLDAIFEDSYKKINRPPEDLSLDSLLKGFEKLCCEYKGSIWVEILLVKGINDSDEEVKEMARFVNKLSVDGIQLNTVSRSTTVPGTGPVSMKKLKEFKGYFEHPVDIFD
ncbi:radical SAM protein [Natranaerofaba carboxydovora]|uniref:radical SAM protein n=1 Tax=Natranaerofaba carboxydovora TaxID=2742683 RepID=UPI001F14223A|nr:radical SAM protein [Natranaerofaba carboxydovora]UMZ73124.1 Radical SAM superfamily protein [Natranaerofaba carboxydovora]